MSKRSDEDLIKDILEATNRIITYRGSMSYEEFMKDEMSQDAIIRNFEIIGEATKNVSSDLKNIHTQIEWSDIARLRDKLIHHYFGINLDIVFDIVDDKLSDLKTHLTKTLEQIQDGKK